MKVLFDPIYSTQPHKCSSAYKYKRIASDLLAARDDAFIYWPIPDWSDEEARDWFPKDPRIKYIETEACKDRVREYQIFYKELEDRISFFGSLWDYDVLITMRTALVPIIRVSMNSPRLKRLPWMKKVVLLEEMAILGFRKTVPTSNPAVQDISTIAGYLASDVSYITANHVRDGIIQTAKGIFAPKQVMSLREKLRLASPISLQEVQTKAPEHMFKRGEEPFCLGFVGRMSNSMTRLPEVYEVMDKNWILKGDKGFKVIISTVTTGIKLTPPDFVIVEHNPRDVFWKRVREDMHLVISMSIDAEFSLSLIEPVMLGTPLVIAREEWTEGLLGPEYPFFVDNKTQAYGMVKAFHDNYAAMYERFLEWRGSTFVPRFGPNGIYSRNLYEDVLSEIVAYDDYVAKKLIEDHPVRGNNAVAKIISERVQDRESFNLMEVLEELAEDGAFRNLGNKLGEANVNRNLTFMSPWHEMKVLLRTFYGFTDASVEVGHMRKKAQ